MTKYDIMIAPVFVTACVYVMYKVVMDIVEMKEDRPKVTDDMVEEAWRNQVMNDFDSEFDSVNWEDQL